MMIQPQRTRLPSSVIRRAAYDRLIPGGSDSGYLHWIALQKRRFEQEHPEHVKKSADGARAFDDWMESLK